MAIFGLAIGGFEMLRQRQAFALAMATHHHDRFDNVMSAPSTLLGLRPFAKSDEYHLEIEGKWWEAARRPWPPSNPTGPSRNESLRAQAVDNS